MKNYVENKDIIDRKAASRLLKVSIRTLDRYRRAGQITTRIIDNKILLSKSEILEFIARKHDLITRHSRQYESVDLSRDRNVDMERDGDDIEVVHIAESGSRKMKTPDREQDTQHDTQEPPRVATVDKELMETYKRMHDELAAHLRARQEELEAAHYRIGQLEGQLKYAVTLPEHKKEILRLEESTQSLEAQVTDTLSRLKKIREAFYYEKFNKRIYLAIAFTLLLLQPLWLLFIS